MVTMDDVDLGKDRTQLIDFIYGNQSAKDESNSVSPSVNSSSLPHTEPRDDKPLQQKRERTPKKPAKRVTCASSLCIFLFLLALFAILFAAFLGHYITKQDLASDHTSEPIAMCKNFTRPNKKPHHPIVNEEDADENDVVSQPTKEQLALPNDIVPVWYKVSLSPKGGSSGTDGVALVKLNITEPTNRIVLNSKGIDITKNLEKIQISREVAVRVKKSTNEEVAEGSGALEDPVAAPTTPKPEENQLIDSGIHVTGVEIDEELEKATITLDGKLEKGANVVVKIPFVSRASNNNGLKEYKYLSGNQTQSMFTTQPTFAYLRHVFPSFDQEAFRAPAALTLMHSKNSVVVANTPVQTVDDGDSLTSTLQKTFEPDFVIGNLVPSHVNTSSGIQVRVWTRPEVEESIGAALKYSDEAIDALEHILQSRLESKELDIVAVPGFEQGNRVSPSFIILPESDVFFNENANDISQKVRLVRTLANRLAAQWFGGITNPEEYGTFWLNDALPKYLEYQVLERVLGVDADDLWTFEMESVLEKDAAATSRPLRVKNVHSAADIAEIDHEFIGEKGAAVLRMVEKAVGRDTFNNAIRSFVSSYRTSFPYDDGLWKSFEKSIGDKIRGWNNEPLNVGKFVNTWVDQIGFPLVSVNKLDDENVELVQERFKNDAETPEYFNYRNAKYWFNWEVPLFVFSDGNVGNVSWLHEAFRLPLNASDTILLNNDSNGIYRVNYEEKRWDDISKQLENGHTKFTERTRAKLLSDAFALANSGQIPYETALNITSYLPKESQTLPWLIATNGFYRLIQRLEGFPLQDKLNHFVFDKAVGKFNEISKATNEDDYLRSLLRSNLFDLISLINPEKTNAKLGELFREEFLEKCHINSGNFSSQCSEVPGDLRAKTYCNGVEFGNDDVFQAVKSFADREVDGKEKDSLIESLACFRNPRTLRSLLANSLNSTSLTVQLMRTMNSRPVGREIVTNFILDNWSILKKKFHTDPDSLNSIVNAGVVLTTEREKSTLENFINHHHKSTTPIESFEQKLESATSDIYWRKSRGQEVGDYLNGKMRGPAKDEPADNSEEE